MFQLFLLPRDAMHKRDLCRHTVTFVYFVKTIKYSFEFFFAIEYPHYSTRDTKLYGNIPTADSPNGPRGSRMQVG